MADQGLQILQDKEGDPAVKPEPLLGVAPDDRLLYLNHWQHAGLHVGNDPELCSGDTVQAKVLDGTSHFDSRSKIS
jgi:hypothetical protein